MQQENKFEWATMEICSGRLINSITLGGTSSIESLHLDMIHRTFIGRQHQPLYVILAVMLLLSTFWIHDLEDAHWMQLAFSLAAFVSLAAYVLSRKIVLSVSAGCSTMKVIIAGGAANLQPALRFLAQIDNAALSTRSASRTQNVSTGHAGPPARSPATGGSDTLGGGQVPVAGASTDSEWHR